MDQFSSSVSTLLAAALAALGAFLNFLVQIFGFFILLINTILSSLHL